VTEAIWTHRTVGRNWPSSSDCKMLTSDSYRDPSAKGRKRPSYYDWSDSKINKFFFFSLSLEFVFSSIISRISNIHIHSGCHFTEQKLKVKKNQILPYLDAISSQRLRHALLLSREVITAGSLIWTDFCVVAEILLTEKGDHCVGDWNTAYNRHQYIQLFYSLDRFPATGSS